MRIWIVNQYVVPPSDPGSVRSFALAKELVQLGHEVTIVAGDFNHWMRKGVRLKEGQDEVFEVIEGVTFLWMRVYPYQGSSVKRLLSMLFFAQRVTSSPLLKGLARPDVILGSNPHLFAVYAAERLAHSLDSAFIFEVRDMWPQSLVDLGKLSERHPMIYAMRKIESHLIRVAGAIVTLPPITPDYFVNKGAKRENIFWVPNGIYSPDLPAVKPLPKNEKFTLVFPGIYGLANGLDTVLEAASLLQEAGIENVHIRLIGDGWEKDRLVAKAQQLELRNVEFCLPVPKSQIFDEISAADAGLLVINKSPVFRWGISPNKLFDYMGAGRPVLYSVEASNNPIEEADAGISVTADSAPALAEGIVKLMETPESRRAEMGMNGRRYVEEKHDLAKLGKVLERAMQVAIEQKEMEI